MLAPQNERTRRFGLSLRNLEESSSSGSEGNCNSWLISLLISATSEIDNFPAGGLGGGEKKSCILEDDSDCFIGVCIEREASTILRAIRVTKIQKCVENWKVCVMRVGILCGFLVFSSFPSQMRATFRSHQSSVRGFYLPPFKCSFFIGPRHRKSAVHFCLLLRTVRTNLMRKRWSTVSK